MNMEMRHSPRQKNFTAEEQEFADNINGAILWCRHFLEDNVSAGMKTKSWAFDIRSRTWKDNDVAVHAKSVLGKIYDILKDAFPASSEEDPAFGRIPHTALALLKSVKEYDSLPRKISSEDIQRIALVLISIRKKKGILAPDNAYTPIYSRNDSYSPPPRGQVGGFAGNPMGPHSRGRFGQHL